MGSLARHRGAVRGPCKVSTEEMVPTVQARPEDFDFAMVEEADGHIPDSKTMGMLLRFEAQRGIELVLSSG